METIYYECTFYKGDILTIQKTYNGIWVISYKEHKERFLLYTKKQALKTFKQNLKTLAI